MRTSISKRPSLRFIVDPAGADPAAGGAGGGAPAAAGTDPKPGDPDPKTDEPLGENGLKALNAERDARKLADQKVKDLEKQIEDSKKTAEQRAADDLEAEKAGRLAAETRALKFEVAAEAGLDLKLAARLTGATREELVADAAELLTMVGATPANPKPDPNQGGGGNAPAKGVNAGRDLFAEQHPSKKKS